MRRSHRCNVFLAALFLAVVAMIALDCVLLRRAAPVTSAPPQSRPTLKDARDDIHDWLFYRGFVKEPSDRFFDQLVTSISFDGSYASTDEFDFDTAGTVWLRSNSQSTPSRTPCRFLARPQPGP